MIYLSLIISWPLFCDLSSQSCCFSSWKEVWTSTPRGCKQVLNKQNKILGLCWLSYCTEKKSKCDSRAQKYRWRYCSYPYWWKDSMLNIDIPSKLVMGCREQVLWSSAPLFAQVGKFRIQSHPSKDLIYLCPMKPASDGGALKCRAHLSLPSTLCPGQFSYKCLRLCNSTWAIQLLHTVISIYISAADPFSCVLDKPTEIL